MEEVLERLLRVLEQLGTDASGAMQPADSLEELESELSPHRLPKDLRTLWERCDPSRLPIAFFPFQTPSSALHGWKLARELGGIPPAVLVPIAYGGHSHQLWVDISTDQERGGPVLAWAFGGCPFTVIAPTLRDLFDVIAGYLETHRTAEAGRATLGADFLGHLERRVAAGIADEYADHLLEGSIISWGSLPDIGEAYEAWPTPWRRAENVNEGALRPTGRAITITQALSRRERERATITGQVMSLARGADRPGVTIRVGDSSGEATLICMSSPAGPVLGRCYEFDVALTPRADQPAPPPEPSDAVERRFYVDFGVVGIDGVSEVPRPIEQADVL